MAFKVKMLADSVASCGKRLTTMEWTYPRAIHSEIMTHRMLSKNSASSRAIPTDKLIQRVLDDPWVPDYIGANQKGMAPGEELTGDKLALARSTWLQARDAAVGNAQVLMKLGVHKGVVNRLVEPWMWITIIVSATEWPNFFALRLDKMAEPHFQHLARMAKAAMDASVPRQLKDGEWHTPLAPIDAEDSALVARYVGEKLGRDKLAMIGLNQEISEEAKQLAEETLLKISVGRCARVSYLTHEGKRDVSEDVGLHDRLVVQRPLHASPAEHVAQALAAPERVGNFIGWRQYRKTMPNECVESWDDVPRIEG